MYKAMLNSNERVNRHARAVDHCEQKVRHEVAVITRKLMNAEVANARAQEMLAKANVQADAAWRDVQLLRQLEKLTHAFYEFVDNPQYGTRDNIGKIMYTYEQLFDANRVHHNGTPIVIDADDDEPVILRD